MSASGAGAFARVRTGVVSAFEDGRGIGVVRDGGGAEYGFHCTAISDGSRTIEVATAVVFELRPGPLGTVEATRLSSAAMIAPAPA